MATAAPVSTSPRSAAHKLVACARKLPGVSSNVFNGGNSARNSSAAIIPTISESLAGRARIVELWPLTQAEIGATRSTFVDALFGSTTDLRKIPAAPVVRKEAFERVTIGGFPAALRMSSARDRIDWFGDYLTTLLQRDLAQLRIPRRTVDLARLLRLLGQQRSGSASRRAYAPGGGSAHERPGFGALVRLNRARARRRVSGGPGGRLVVTSDPTNIARLDPTSGQTMGKRRGGTVPIDVPG